MRLRKRPRKKYLDIVRKMKKKAGVKVHIKSYTLSGMAYPEGKIICAPMGCDRIELFCIAHECGHVKLHGERWNIPLYLKEYEATVYAIEAFRTHKIPVPKVMVEHAKNYVKWHVKKWIILNESSIDLGYVTDIDTSVKTFIGYSRHDEISTMAKDLVKWKADNIFRELTKQMKQVQEKETA